jgi:hypothetical protein
VSEAAPEVGYDAGLGVLTLTLAAADDLDAVEVVDDVVLFFDAGAAGRLVEAHLLVPADATAAWRVVVVGSLGPTLGRHALGLVDAGTDAWPHTVTVPKAELARLRGVQWPLLHRAWRAGARLPALADRVPADRVPAGVGPVLVPAVPVALARSVAVLPDVLAERWGIDGPIEIRLEGDTARVTARLRPRGRRPAVEVALVVPEPRSAEAVTLRPDGPSASAAVPLRSTVDPRQAAPVLVQVGARRAAAREPSPSPFVAILDDTGRALRRLFGVRQPVAGSVSYGGAEVGRTADRVWWEGTGTPPLDVVVFREGRTLWARGFAKRSRRGRRVHLRCRLRPEAVAALRPGGGTGPEAGLLEAEGRVDGEGFFQLRLAAVEPARYRRELVDQLELRIGG